jgi:thiamine biosynthesis lipoprotein
MSPARLRSGGRSAVLGIAVVLVSCESASGPHELSGPTMGSLYHVTIDDALTEREREEARSVVEERLRELERLLSTYDSASEVSRFNRHESTDPFPVSKEVIDVLSLARHVSERSGGALDVTVAPLVDAWGFGPLDQQGSFPDAATVGELLTHVGWDLVVIDEAASTITKKDPAVRVDLSALGQGYAVEAVSAALEELGLGNFLVEMSGELKAVGSRRDGTPWRIGIEAPAEGPAGLWGTVELSDEGISTAGDYLNYIELAGLRYSHLVDPRTGRPLPLVGLSVSVVHESALVADAWDTALAVLGPYAGYALAEQEGLGAVFITRDGDGFRAWTTPALAERVEQIAGG